jgi:serine/threonine-protein kinase
VLGTPFYMAPEQVTGEKITEQVDIYAFGVLLFEMLTGRKPVEGEAVERIFYSILHEPLKMEPLYEAGTPQGVCDLIARCTAKNPAGRPLGFGAVLTELDRIIAGMDAPTQAMPSMAAPDLLAAPAPAAPLPVTKAARPGWLMPAVLGSIVALAAGLYFATRPKGVPDATPRVSAALARSLDGKGGPMVLVDAGEFLVGQNKERGTLAAFYIDKTEVSNGEYAKFCAETKHALPRNFAAGKPELPVVNVLISDARAFAAWAGKRLPKSREWEKAARGKDGFIYPWGNEADTARANVGSGKLLPVDSLPAGASPYGALNMSGNVWELVDEVDAPGEGSFGGFTNLFKGYGIAAPTKTETWYIFRGQGYGAQERLEPSGLWDHNTVPERGWADNIGFRCVRDMP